MDEYYRATIGVTCLHNVELYASAAFDFVILHDGPPLLTLLQNSSTAAMNEMDSSWSLAMKK
jgi:hypothetical protein